MFIIRGRCPICYAPCNSGELCAACGGLPEIYYESELQPREKINVTRIQGVVDAARGRLARYPDDGVARYSLGLSYIHLNLIEEGLAELRRAASLLPEKVEISYEVSALLVKYGLNTNEALERLRTVIGRRPDFKEALYLRGIVLEMQGKLSQAVRDWQAAYRIESQYSPALKRLEGFISAERQSLAVSKLNATNLDDISKTYLDLITAPMPSEPPPLGKTSLSLLMEFSMNTAQRMQKMHADRVRGYEVALNDYKKAFQEMEGDVLGLCNLCLASFLANKKLQTPQDTPLKSLTIQERSAILDGAIQRYVKVGYRLSSRTETAAHLYRPKQFSCCAAIILVFLVIGIVLYLLYYLTKKDDVVYLEVDEYGRLKTTYS